MCCVNDMKFGSLILQIVHSHPPCLISDDVPGFGVIVVVVVAAAVVTEDFVAAGGVFFLTCMVVWRSHSSCVANLALHSMHR